MPEFEKPPGVEGGFPRMGQALRPHHEAMDLTAPLHALEGILAGHPVTLAAQPIVRLHPDPGAPRWVEVLIRPKHAEAAHLVALAEGRGYGATLDLAVLNAALEWMSAPSSAERVSINVTAGALSTASFAREALAAIRATGVEPQRLCIEVSERDDLARDRQAERTLLELHDAGLLISIDDFGVGCANLQLLTQIHPVAIKIDQRVIQSAVDPDHRLLGPRLMAALAVFAGALETLLICEGVETLEQFAALRRLPLLRNAYAQGYALGHPALLPSAAPSMEEIPA
jgi:EAL domain-containing protein (putative c-di-GMP-specific phosphodiesterase class I)